MNEAPYPWRAKSAFHQPAARHGLRASCAEVSVTMGIVFIVDQCKPNFASITNAAETVVDECLAKYGEKRIVYRDSDGRWSELLHTGIMFRGFAAYEGPVPA